MRRVRRRRRRRRRRKRRRIRRRRRRERQDRKNRGYKDKGTESRWSLLGEEVWQEERAALT